MVLSCSEKPPAGIPHAPHPAQSAPVTIHSACGILEDMEKWAFYQLSGPGSPRVIPLQSSEVCVGRGSQADVQILDTQASRRHAVITVEDRELLLEDQGSANGTFVADERVRRARLGLGDSFVIGQSRFHMMRPGELLSPGCAIGTWEIVELLAVNEVSWRYRARQKVLDREVELEVLRENFTADTELLEFYRSVLRRVAAGADAALVPVFDLCEENGSVLVARRLSVLNQVPWESLTLRDRAGFLGDLLAILDRWSERGMIVPLDLDQITTCAEGHIQLRLPSALDLYLTRHRLLGRVPRCLPCAAPEELVSASGPMTASCEAYRLGVLLHEALTGRRPRQGRNVKELAAAFSQPLQTLRQLTPPIPSGASQLITALLDRSPEARPSLHEAAAIWPSFAFPARLPPPPRETRAPSPPAERSPGETPAPRDSRRPQPSAAPPFTPRSQGSRFLVTMLFLGLQVGIFLVSARIVYWLMKNVRALH